jgi:hypothetical protein
MKLLFTVNLGSSGKQNEIATHGFVMSVCKFYETAFDETGYERCVQPFCLPLVRLIVRNGLM